MRAMLATLLAILAFGSPAKADDWSPAYRERLKKEVAMRKARKGTRPARPGVIETYPMPPVLIIRQTPQVHDEIKGLLDLLRQ